MFSCKFCRNFKNTVFTEHLWTTASVCQGGLQICSFFYYFFGLALLLKKLFFDMNIWKNFYSGLALVLSVQFVSDLFELNTFAHLFETKITEAVVRRCSAKKVFLKIWQKSQENTCAIVPCLTKLQASGLLVYWLWHRCFPVNSA